MSIAGREDVWKDFFQRVDSAALNRLDLLQTYLPGGHLSGREYRAGNLNGEPGKSFGFNIQTGVWADFADASKGGLGMVALVARVRGLRMSEAALELARTLGIDAPRSSGLRVVKSEWEPVSPVPDGVFMRELPAGCPAHAHGKLKQGSTAWGYLDEHGRLLMYRVRVDFENGGKEVLPVTYCLNKQTHDHAWRWRDLIGPKPLYNLEVLARAKPDAPVLIVSGEKCVEAAQRLLPDWVCMTWPGGDKRAGRRDSDWRPLLRHKGQIYIWPDNDTSGKDAALVVADALKECSPLIVRPDPAWPEKYDIADLIDAGWTGPRIVEFVRDASSSEVQGEALFRVPVDISVGDLELQAEAIWEAVRKVNNPPTLLRNSLGLVVVDRDIFDRARMRVAGLSLLRWWLCKHLAFQRTLAGGIQISTFPGDALLAYLMQGKHGIPVLQRLTEVPVFAPDGRLISVEGYDAASGVYYLPALSLRGMKVIERPTVDDVQDALDLFNDLLCDFPFVADTDRVHALAFAILPLIRMMIAGRTPLFRFEAPTPGTGKSLLMRLLARLTAINIADFSPCDDENEWRKRITAALVSDPDYVLIDNVEKLESVQLKKLLTDDYWEDRPMRESYTVRIAVRQVFGASLNNPIITQEMIRRSLRVRLDSRQEHPEARGGWRHSAIEEYAAANRARLVAALLILTEYGLRVGGSEQGPLLGGFEAFTRTVGTIMRSLGLSGFLGDRNDASAVASSEQLLATMVQIWSERFGALHVTTTDLVTVAEDAGFQWYGNVKTERGKATAIGMWLAKRRDCVVGNYQIRSVDRRCWALVKTFETFSDNSSY